MPLGSSLYPPKQCFAWVRTALETGSAFGLENNGRLFFEGIYTDKRSTWGLSNGNGQEVGMVSG